MRPFAISAKMVGESPPEKRLKLEDANNLEQDEIRRLKEAVKEQKELVKEQEKMLASANKKLFEMEESKKKAESEKNKVVRENMNVERERAKVWDEKMKLLERHRMNMIEFQELSEKHEDEKNELEAKLRKLENEKVKLEDAKNKLEAKLRKLVECPVCLALPRKGPVPCCANGHLVCSPCLGKLREENKLDCPTCREPFGEGKSLLAFAVAEEVQHECRHQGCTKTTPVDQIVQHEKECKWRLVLCPGGGLDCTAMIPFCKVEDHAQECRECEWPPKELESQEDGIIFTNRFDRTTRALMLCWTTELILYEGKLFFCRAFMNNGIFTVDVAMKGSLEECKEFRIEAAVLDPNADEDEPAVKAIFRPRPLKEDNEHGFCLTVPFSLMSEVGNAEDGEVNIEVAIKVVKA